MKIDPIGVGMIVCGAHWLLRNGLAGKEVAGEEENSEVFDYPELKLHPI